MSTGADRRRLRAARTAAPRRRGGAVWLALLGLVIAQVLLPPDRRAAAGIAPADAVPAIVSSYGDLGVLAVAVARQQQPATGMSVRAAEASAQRIASLRADNGAVAARPIPAASMVKLFMAEDILRRARAGNLSLGPRERTLLREMIRRSDDPAASALWVRYDGDRMVRDVARRYGLTGTAPPSIPGQWGQTLITARDVARFLSLLPVVAHPDDAETLLTWMREATPIAADGFDQSFGLFGVPHDDVAVKQGWMCCVGGHRHVHSVAVVGRTVVVLLSEVDADVGYDAARAALTAAAAALPTRKHR